MIKLKEIIGDTIFDPTEKDKLIKEGSPGFIKREFGDPLPTFKDIAETHQNKPKEQITEESLPKFQSLKDVSYYGRDWGKVFKELGSGYPRLDYGPRESDMYDWNSRANYQAATKEYHTHMSKVAKKLNTATKELDGLYIDKHRKNDGR